MKKLVALALLAVIAPSAPAVAPETPVLPYREGEIVVQYRAGLAADVRADLRARLGLTPVRGLAERTELLALPRVTTTGDVLPLLRAAPEVERAEPNFRRLMRAVVPNDPLFPLQWGLHNTGQANFVGGGPAGTPGADMNLIHAWDANNDGAPDRTGSASVVVAIIDDGFETGHPDLAPNMRPGRNFVPGQDAGDPRPLCPEEQHGTLVAGCVGARGHDGFGVAGVAWNAALLPLKFGFDSASHIQALSWARDQGVHIVNASFGGPGYSQLERDAIASLAAHDILYVAAAGNDDSNTDHAQLNYPANYDADNIVTAAATNRQDDIASFSQYGPLTIDVAAPGLQIVTTALGQTHATTGVSGTSFSAPYTAGVAALIKSHVAPVPDYHEIRARLIESGTAAPGANATERTAGGRIDADAALDMADRPALVLSGVTVDDPNGALDPGETVPVTFTVRNLWQDATGVTATLTSADGGIAVNTGTVALGDIPARGEAVATFEVTVDGAAGVHRYAPFALTLAADGGYSAVRPWLTEVAQLADATTAAPAFSGDLYDEFHAWNYAVPAGDGPRTLVIRTRTDAADIDLLARRDLPPQYSITVGINPEAEFGFFCTSGVTADCQDPGTLVSARLDGVEAVTVENPLAGSFYHLVVVNFDQAAVGYELVASVEPGDLRPDPFAFADRTGVSRNVLVESDPVTITGIDRPTFVTVVGGEYRVDGGAYTAAEGSIAPGQTLRVRTSSGPAASARMQVTVGGVTDTFTVNAPPPPAPPTGCAPPGGGGGGGALSISLLALLLLARGRRAHRRA